MSKPKKIKDSDNKTRNKSGDNIKGSPQQATSSANMSSKKQSNTPKVKQDSGDSLFSIEQVSSYLKDLKFSAPKETSDASHSRDIPEYRSSKPSPKPTPPSNKKLSSNNSRQQPGSPSFRSSPTSSNGYSHEKSSNMSPQFHYKYNNSPRFSHSSGEHSTPGASIHRSSPKPRTISSPYSPNPKKSVSSMISIGNMTSSKLTLYINAANCGMDTTKLSTLLKTIVTKYIQPHRDTSNNSTPKKIVILQFNLSGNILDDSSMPKLLGFLRQHAEYLTVRALKLFHNRIGDVGVSAISQYLDRDDVTGFQELHLSHNKITTKGALELLNVLAKSPKYPFPKDQDKHSVPLWLRLEHNFICAAECQHVLKELGTPVCIIEAKGSQCTSTTCCKPDAKLHLVYLNFQYWNESLEKAKQAMASMRSQASGTSTAGQATDSSSTEDSKKNAGSEAQVKLNDSGRYKSSMSHLIQKSSEIDHSLLNGPLYLFMDTNAVVTAILEPSHRFSFENLKKMHKKGKFGSDDISDRVVLVVTDTVLGELDGMHKKHIVKSSSITKYLTEAEQDGYLVMLGAHQGEKLVHALEKPGAGNNLDVTTSNDRMIVDIGLMFAEELGDIRCVMFVSEDKAARLTSRNRGLGSISMSMIATILSRSKSLESAWNASNLREWFLEAAPLKKNLDGEEIQNVNPLAHLRVLKSNLASVEQLVKDLELDQSQNDKKSAILDLITNMVESLSHVTILPAVAAKKQVDEELSASNQPENEVWMSSEDLIQEPEQEKDTEDQQKDDTDEEEDEEEDQEDQQDMEQAKDSQEEQQDDNDNDDDDDDDQEEEGDMKEEKDNSNQQDQGNDNVDQEEVDQEDEEDEEASSNKISEAQEE